MNGTVFERTPGKFYFRVPFKRENGTYGTTWRGSYPTRELADDAKRLFREGKLPTRPRAGRPQSNIRPKYRTKTLEERIAWFWEHVDKGGPIAAYNPGLGACWIWTAAKDSSGYGNFQFLGRMKKAHQVMWFLMGHASPDKGLQLDHLCRTPSCVNPDHLELVTAAENMRRAVEAKRHLRVLSA